MQLKPAKKKVKAKGSADHKLQTLVDTRRKPQAAAEVGGLGDWQGGKQTNHSGHLQIHLDPHISVLWCKNMEVPVDKIYSKSQRDTFTAWAIDMTEGDFVS